MRDLEAERDALIAQRGACQVSQEQFDTLSDWLGTVGANIDTLSYAQKRGLLAALDLQVTLYPAAHTPRYTITASLPLDDDIVYASHRRTSMPRGTSTTSHPIMQSFQPGEDWLWCYMDEVMMEPA